MAQAVAEVFNTGSHQLITAYRRYETASEKHLMHKIMNLETVGYVCTRRIFRKTTTFLDDNLDGIL